MADHNVPLTGKTFNLNVGDRLLTYEGYGVRVLSVDSLAVVKINDRIGSNYKKLTTRFPQLGHSLPCVFTVQAVGSENQACEVYAEEYGGVPDPDYFNIIDLDDDGLPIYSGLSKSNDIVLYKKPVENGSFLDKEIINTIPNTNENLLKYGLAPSPTEEELA